MTKRIYIDANILISAFKCQDDQNKGWRRAIEVLDDPERNLVVSEYLRLEVLPKPTYLKRGDEIQFMEEILGSATEYISSSPELVKRAVLMASKYDMSPMDALHISAAMEAQVDEFVTMEKHEKPICKVKELNVISLHSK